MNNSGKFKRTQDDIRNIKEKYNPNLGKEPQSLNDPESLNSLTFQIGSLRIDKKGEILSFKPFQIGNLINEGVEIVSFASLYKVPLKEEETINTVPICVLVTLYETELQRALKTREKLIRYDLIELWKMNRVIELLEDFFKLQDELYKVLENEIQAIQEQKKIVKLGKPSNINSQQKAFNKIRRQITQNQAINLYYQNTILDEEEKIQYGLKPDELDVVPLCKMLTQYCWFVFSEIDSYNKEYYQKDKTARFRNLDEISKKFLDLMEVHFDLRKFFDFKLLF